MTVKHLLMAVEIFLLILFLVPLPVICSGNIAGMLLCFALLAITANWKGFCGIVSSVWSHLWGKILLIFIAAVIVVGIVYVSVLSVLMYRAQENTPDEPNVIVVLGCKVKGQKPSRMLRRRLEAAFDALNRHPDVLCIVSGGQGSNEEISEALAMKKYLCEKGIDESRIIMEDRSTSTYENIQFSLDILDSLGMSHDMTLVTDGFHQYRASLIARSQGVENVTAYSAYTEPRYLFTYWVREWLGLTHFYVFGN